jgi:hypothetical protein
VEFFRPFFWLHDHFDGWVLLNGSLSPYFIFWFFNHTNLPKKVFVKQNSWNKYSKNIIVIIY